MKISRILVRLDPPSSSNAINDKGDIETPPMMSLKMRDFVSIDRFLFATCSNENDNRNTDGEGFLTQGVESDRMTDEDDGLGEEETNGRIKSKLKMGSDLDDSNQMISSQEKNLSICVKDENSSKNQRQAWKQQVTKSTISSMSEPWLNDEIVDEEACSPSIYSILDSREQSSSQSDDDDISSNSILGMDYINMLPRVSLSSAVHADKESGNTHRDSVNASDFVLEGHHVGSGAVPASSFPVELSGRGLRQVTIVQLPGQGQGQTDASSHAEAHKRRVKQRKSQLLKSILRGDGQCASVPRIKVLRDPLLDPLKLDLLGTMSPLERPLCRAILAKQKPRGIPNYARVADEASRLAESSHPTASVSRDTITTTTMTTAATTPVQSRKAVLTHSSSSASLSATRIRQKESSSSSRRRPRGVNANNMSPDAQQEASRAAVARLLRDIEREGESSSHSACGGGWTGSVGAVMEQDPQVLQQQHLQLLQTVATSSINHKELCDVQKSPSLGSGVLSIRRRLINLPDPDKIHAIVTKTPPGAPRLPLSSNLGRAVALPAIAGLGSGNISMNCPVASDSVLRSVRNDVVDVIVSQTMTMPADMPPSTAEVGSEGSSCITGNRDPIMCLSVSHSLTLDVDSTTNAAELSGPVGDKVLEPFSDEIESPVQRGKDSPLVRNHIDLFSFAQADFSGDKRDSSIASLVGVESHDASTSEYLLLQHGFSVASNYDFGPRVTSPPPNEVKPLRDLSVSRSAHLFPLPFPQRPNRLVVSKSDFVFALEDRKILREYSSGAAGYMSGEIVSPGYMGPAGGGGAALRVALRDTQRTKMLFERFAAAAANCTSSFLISNDTKLLRGGQRTQSSSVSPSATGILRKNAALLKAGTIRDNRGGGNVAVVGKGAAGCRS